MKSKEIKKAVKTGYARVAKQECSCCGPTNTCGPSGSAGTISRQIGYTDEELQAVPVGANLGLGCGNPVALALLKQGETVLDLGSGPGLDCFLAAQKVGATGRVIGVDMTPEMIKKAKANARKGDYQNVEFRLGEIESLPVDDNSVDVIISNCVINLSPDKPKVFKESFRVLRPGGRLMVSDIVLVKELPAVIMNSVEAYIGCLSGAIRKDKYLDAVKSAGFADVKIIDEASFPVELMANDPTAKALMKNLNLTEEIMRGLAHSVVSLKVSVVKPE